MAGRLHTRRGRLTSTHRKRRAKLGERGGLARARNLPPRSERPPPAKTPRYYFTLQRKSARERGVAWEMTFEEWLAVWVESGKWEQRGRKKGQYVMARHGDVGPYKVGNVSIVTTEQNIREARHSKPSAGYSYRPDKSASRPYAARYAGKHLGNYATPEEATAAHQAAKQAHI